MLGRPVVGEVRLGLGFDLTTPVGRSWISILRLLLQELDEEQSLVRRSAAHREALERLLIGTLLRSHRHEFSDALSTDHPPVRSRTVKRVVDAVRAAPERAWTVTDMAQVAGVGARRLQQGFREQIGMGPMAYLRVVRLERVRTDLLLGVGTVTEVASRWGFTHPGRFAETYRQRFGEAPSRTLRNA